jgi:cysteinyl-tRNA synthetase
MHNAWITTAGEKMSKSLGNSLLIPHVLERVRGIELRFYLVAAHYRSHVEFSYEALEESAVGFRRIESFLERVGAVEPGGVPQGFTDAMNDDLGTSAAVAVLYDAVREGNRLLAAGDAAGAQGQAAGVLAMLDVLGLSPYDQTWSRDAAGSSDTRLTSAVDTLVRGLLDQRAEARSNRDFAAADAIREQIKAAGIEIEDTPTGPKWSLEAGNN